MAYRSWKAGLRRFNRFRRSNRRDLNSNNAFTLASLLITISTIFISVLASGNAINSPILYGIIGFLSVSTAALLVDWVLDKNLKMVWFERLIFLNGGYVLFSLTMSSVAFGVLYFTNAARNCISGEVLTPHNMLFGATSLFLFLKIMTKEDKQAWLIGLIFFAVLSVSSIIHYPNVPLIDFITKIIICDR